MKNLLTKKDIYQPRFLKMPHDFFYGTKYKAMRLESKVAYTLLLNQLSLSIANNWVNEKGQVFVKLSRKNLMLLLGIKGTQKMAQVMRELEEYKLVLNKRLGLNKCNEIYLYPIDGESSPKKHQDPRSKQTHSQETSRSTAPRLEPASSSPADATADLAEVENLLKNQLHIEDLKQQYDPVFVDEICNNIHDMFLSTSTRIGSQNKPQVIMRSVIRKLKMHHIEHVINQFREVAITQEIFNPKRYIQTMIYNSICESNIKIIGHIGYHFGYC